MSEVTTTKRVDLAQLSVELGGGIELSARTTEGSTTVTCDVPAITQAQLQAAVDAHVAVDETGNRATLEQQAITAMQNNRDDIASNDAYAAIANPTNAQVAARVKVLNTQSTRQARELNGLIRLVLNRLDGTD